MCSILGIDLDIQRDQHVVPELPEAALERFLQLSLAWIVRYYREPLSIPAHKAQVVKRHNDSEELHLLGHYLIPIRERYVDGPEEASHCEDSISLDPVEEELVQSF